MNPEHASALDEARRVSLITLTQERAGEAFGEALATAVHTLCFHVEMISVSDALSVLTLDEIGSLTQEGRGLLKRAVDDICVALDQPALFGPKPT